jgi:hypothetical protein
MTNLTQKTTPSAGLAAWRQQNKFRLQALSLIVSLAAPFALYAAMEGGQTALAIGCFAVLVAAMALAIWIG